MTVLKHIVGAAVLLMCVTVSCAEPEVYEEYILSGQEGYSFTVPVEDDGVLYELEFFTRNDSEFSWKGDYVRMDVKWKSPSGREADETVYLPSSDRSGGVYPYRDSIRFTEKGDWNLTAKVYSDTTFAGLGVILKKM